MIYILTVVIVLYSSGTSYTVQYDNQQACENAKNITREQLQKGSIVLLTCTPKSVK